MLLLPPTIAMSSKGNLVSFSPSTDVLDAAAIGFREFYPSSAFSYGALAYGIRVTFAASNSASSTISSAFIGHAGTAPNFDGNQKQLFFNGSAGVTISANGSATSDLCYFNFDGTKGLIVSIGYSAHNGRYVPSGMPSGGTNYYKTGANADAGLTTVSGYSNNTNALDVVSVELFV